MLGLCPLGVLLVSCWCAVGVLCIVAQHVHTILRCCFAMPHGLSCRQRWRGLAHNWQLGMDRVEWGMVGWDGMGGKRGGVD